MTQITQNGNTRDENSFQLQHCCGSDATHNGFIEISPIPPAAVASITKPLQLKTLRRLRSYCGVH